MCHVKENRLPVDCCVICLPNVVLLTNVKHESGKRENWLLVECFEGNAIRLTAQNLVLNC